MSPVEVFGLGLGLGYLIGLLESLVVMFMSGRIPWPWKEVK